MPKLIVSGSFDFGDDPVFPVIVDDPVILRKCASSSVVHQWGDIGPQKNASLIHLIALGAHETTGANRNGDFFRRAFLQSAHPTFKKHGALYRDHKNKDYSKRDGEVEKTAFNDEMDRVELLVKADHEKCADWLGELEKGNRVDFSMGFDCEYDVCLRGNTNIFTHEGVKKINHIKSGDLVLSHTGHWRKVRETMVRDFKGGMVSISAAGLPKECVSTHNHPYYILPQEDLYACRGSAGGKKRRHTIDSRGICKHCKKGITNPKWVKASEVKPGDYVAFPVPQAPPTTVSITAGEAAILGFYTGDGALIWGKRRNGQRTTPRGLSITLDNDHPAIQNRLKELAPFREYPSGGGRDSKVYNLTNPSLAMLAKELVGEGSQIKTLSSQILGWNREAKLAFLGGYLDTDGSVDPKKGSTRIVTTSELLASTIFALCLSVGIAPAIHDDFVTTDFTPEGVRIWVIHIGAAYTQKLAKHSIKAGSLGKDKRHKDVSFFAHGCLWVAVKEVSSYQDELPVFNFSVEEDESYVAELMVVHNCSICSHKAPTRKDYCEHVKKGAKAPYGMGRILPDGRKCCVDNPSGVFNDISKVPVGADMIAQSLRKVAGVDEEIIGGAELAEEMCPEVSREKFASKIALAEKLSRMEKLVPMTAAKLEINDEKIDEKTAAVLRDMPVRKMFGELAKLGCVLPFNSFFSLMMGDRIDDLQPHLGDAEKAAHLAFSHLMAHDELLDKVCAIGSYECDKVVFSKLGTLQADVLQTSHGLHEDLIDRRMVKVAMTGTRRIERVAPESISPAAMELLCEYASYKIAALESGAFVLNDSILYAAAASH
jgi:hypothetical protein